MYGVCFVSARAGETLVEIEEDRRAEVHGANVRREQYNERGKEIQVMSLKAFGVVVGTNLYGIESRKFDRRRQTRS